MRGKRPARALVIVKSTKFGDFAPIVRLFVCFADFSCFETCIRSRGSINDILDNIESLFHDAAEHGFAPPALFHAVLLLRR